MLQIILPHTVLCVNSGEPCMVQYVLCPLYTVVIPLFTEKWTHTAGISFCQYPNLVKLMKSCLFDALDRHQCRETDDDAQ